VKRGLRATLPRAWMLKPGMDQRKDLFASRHCKHSLPCTDLQPAEPLASTRNAFARRAVHSTNCRVSGHGVGSGKKKRPKFTMRLLPSVGIHSAASPSKPASKATHERA